MFWAIPLCWFCWSYFLLLIHEYCHFLSLSIFDLSIDDDTIPPFGGYILSIYFNDSFRTFYKQGEQIIVMIYDIYAKEKMWLSCLLVWQLKLPQLLVIQIHGILMKNVLNVVVLMNLINVPVLYCIMVNDLDLIDPLTL